MSFSSNPTIRIRIHIRNPASSTDIPLLETISSPTTPTLFLAMLLQTPPSHTQTYELLTFTARGKPRTLRQITGSIRLLIETKTETMR